MTAAAALTAEIIAKTLGGAKRAGRNWMAKCPNHDDRTASLSITDNGTKPLIHCHACGKANQAAVWKSVMDALKASGVEVEDDAGLAGSKPERGHTRPYAKEKAKAEPAPKKTGNGNAPVGTIEATYDYHDATGDLLFQVVRFKPKTFRQRRPKGSGWEWGLGRTKPIPFRLPELLAAPEGATAFVVEGEKDVLRLIEIGLVATCNPMGAGKWHPEFGQYFVGKHVAVLPDNDDPGRKHAAEVAASCHGHAKTVRVLALPGLPEKGDVSDWLDAGGTIGQLRQLWKDAPRWRPDAIDPAWENRLITDDEGKPSAIEANVVTALEFAPELAGRLRFNEFKNCPECWDMPWSGTRSGWQEWKNADTGELVDWIQRKGVHIQGPRCERAMETVAYRTPHHPVREYLSALKWDGEPRLDEWLETYLGVQAGTDEAKHRYLEAIGPKALIGAVARVYRPGCQMDTMLVLEGPEGENKSTAIRELVGNDEWFTDQLPSIADTKVTRDQIAGKWLIEVGEMTALQDASVGKGKTFLSTRFDRCRISYGRRSEDFPRQCTFFGTTNERQYLQSTTGNRRIWPVWVGAIDLTAIARDRDQLWAEAVYRYHQGDPWHLSAEEEAIARHEQEKREVPDTWIDAVRLYVTGLDFVTVGMVLVNACGVAKDKWEGRAQKRVVGILQKLGWRPGAGRVPKVEKDQNGNDKPDGYKWRPDTSNCLYGWRKPEK